MVKGVQHKTIEQEAISELVAMSHIHPKLVYPKYVGDFLAYLLTKDMAKAKLLWSNTLRNRVRSTEMDMLLIQEIDEMLEGI